MEGASLSLREEELANELIEQLLRTNSPALRSQLVQKFSDVTSDAHGYLVGVIETQSGEHACVIAQHAKVSAKPLPTRWWSPAMRVMQLSRRKSRQRAATQGC